MTTLILKPKERFKAPVDLRRVSPDRLAGLSLDQVLELAIWEGNRRAKLGDLFDVEVEPGEGEVKLVVHGDPRIWYLGYRMKAGTIEVIGPIGHFTGYKMAGGSIVVRGDAGSWLGSKMRGGTIEVYGSAGHHVGSKLMGERPGKGMRGGIIRIHGDAGCFIGEGMGKGAIIVEGSAGIMPGAHMTGGSIMIKGGCQGLPGARMTGGKVVVCGRTPRVLPSFYADSVVGKAKVKGVVVKGRFILMIGDSVVNGHGKLYLDLDSNPELEELAKLVSVEEVELEPW